MEEKSWQGVWWATVVVGPWHSWLSNTSRRSARQPACPVTQALADTGVYLFNADALILYPGPAWIVIFHKLLIHHETRTYLSPIDIGLQVQTSKQSCHRQNAENGRFPSCHMECNACTWNTQCTQRIESIACIVFLRACVAYFGFPIVSQAVNPLHCVCCIRQLGNRM